MAIDHFEKHKDQIGRTDWNFNFLFSRQPQVAELATEYAPLLRYPGLHNPVPPEWLHATLLRVGFIEEFTEEQMLQAANMLESKLTDIKLPKFILGQWWLWGGNPCLHITPDDPLKQMYKYVVEALTMVTHESRWPEQFMPHITLAYSKTYDDELGLYKQLQAHPIQGVELHIDNVSLIKQHITDDYYRWDVVKELRINQL